MNKKICVYAIAKNEMKFIDRWYNSVKEADYVCVLDTGSTDGSFEKFISLGIICEQKVYNPFRFDTARNDSLKLIPADAEICVCVDIDEFFVPGWSNILRSAWKESVGRARYRYTWNLNPDGSEGVVFMADKVHKNNCYHWEHPVHEILVKNTYSALEQNLSNTQNKNSNSVDNLITIDLPNIQLNHMADNTKSRASYLPLLEISVKENPTDDRNTHYLAREYMFHGEYEKAIKTFKKHLSLPTAIWQAERSASLRYIANCYKQIALIKQQNVLNDKFNKTEKIKNLNLNNKNIIENNKNIVKNNNLNDKNKRINKKITNNYYLNKQIEYLHKAILECQNVREPYFDLAVTYFENNQFLPAAVCFNQMLNIQNRELNYMSTPTCWGALPYDYLSMCYYYLKDYKNAYITVSKALTFGDNERLKNNQTIFANLVNNSTT